LNYIRGTETIVSGLLTVASTITAPFVVIDQATAPQLIMYERDQAAANQKWSFLVDGQGYSIRAYQADPSVLYTELLNLSRAGDLVVIGNVTAYSDRRLKKDIEPIHHPLQKVQALNGVTFKRIDTGEYGTGLIAQDVQAVMAEAVREGPDGMLSVAYGNLVGLLVEAVKALTTKVEILQSEVQSLKDAK
jgi:hypothetical protein